VYRIEPVHPPGRARGSGLASKVVRRARQRHVRDPDPRCCNAALNAPRYEAGPLPGTAPASAMWPR